MKSRLFILYALVLAAGSQGVAFPDTPSVAEANQTHRFEHSTSWKKPSSESHQWSFKGACDVCLAEVERRHGVDWKVTDVEFEDKGRTTKTSQDWQGRRTWRCTHTVVAKYNIVHRGRELDSPELRVVQSEMTIRYSMLNPNYVDPAERSVRSPVISNDAAAVPGAVKKDADASDALVNNDPAAAPQVEIKESGHRRKKEIQPGWEKFLKGGAAAEKASFIVPRETDLAALDQFDALSDLPPIEAFFFGVPETVCLPDDRTRVSDTTAASWSANCQLIITMRDGSQARGTGWLLGPRIVVTAGHCVHDGQDGDFYERIEVIPAMNGPTRPFGSQVIEKAQLRASESWKANGTVALDYGAILLRQEFRSPSGASPANHDVVVKSDSELNALDVFLSGYPADKPVGTQWTDSDPVSGVRVDRLRYMVDTFGGHSGSAVIPVGQTAAVGIHNYGGCPNHCTRITSDVKRDLDQWRTKTING